MFGEKRYPENLPPRHLDNYLAKGWYRMGQSVFTTHFLCFQEKFYSAIWIRLSLQDFRFSKSLRKLIRRNYDKFEIKFQEADINPEKEALFEKYKKTFPGHLAPTLLDSLQEGYDGNVFDTYESCVYDGEKLIAFSFFDLGEDSVASIQGIYDPDYDKNSLGLFTMLLEIIFSLKNNFSYFYPGYVVPENSRFEYKKRIGAVDYYDIKTELWLPFKDLSEADIPINKMEHKLLGLQKTLADNGYPVKYYYYPLFEANLFGYWNAPYFDYPNLLLINPDNAAKKYYAVVFDPKDDAFLFIKCSEFDNVFFYFNSEFVNTFNKEKYLTELITIENVMAESADETDILDMVKRFNKIPVEE